MTEVANLSVNLTAVVFIALGIATGISWYRRRGRADGFLALSLILLAAVATLGRIQALVGLSSPTGRVLNVISILAFLGSGFAVLLFRDSLLPLKLPTIRLAVALLVVSCVIGVAVTLVVGNAGGWISLALALELILSWSIFIGEPIVRFWLASRSLRRVQRARMRALSTGFGMLIAILLVAVLGGSALQSPLAIIAVQVFALAAAPFIYFSFDPPVLLRTYWRMKESAELRAAIRDLLLSSTTQQALAEKAAPWAMRLVGADSCFVVSPKDSFMAYVGIEPERVAAIVAELPGTDTSQTISGRGRTTAVVPLLLTEGNGLLGVETGPYTPMFGTDELQQLDAFATSITAGLERARVGERIAAMERNKSQFLNLASHELRGPVTVIRGYVSMLEKGLCGDLNDLGRQAAHTMSAKVIEINELIEQMMESARLEDDRLFLRPETVDLREIAKAAVEGARPLVDANHSIDLELPETTVPVDVDADRIQTILANLISNALKYSPAGGPVRCVVVLRSYLASVSVSDTGLGIAVEDMSILFTRFGRVATPETEHLPGTGLGLFLGQQLAHLHGGEITVESRLGEGSTFTLLLPQSAGNRKLSDRTRPRAPTRAIPDRSA